MAGSGRLEAGGEEAVVRSLTPPSVLGLGTSAWFSQAAAWETLNGASHTAAAARAHDEALAALLTWDRLPSAVAGVLAVEAWRGHILPRIRGAMVAKDAASCPLRAYFILFHEATLVNLLESVLYHDYAAEALGDALVDLVDYAVRQVAALIGETHARNALTPAERAALRRQRGGGVEEEGEEEDNDDEDVLESAASSGGGGSGSGGGGSSGSGSGTGESASSRATAARVAAESASSGASARRAMRKWERQLSFAIGVSCVTILRYLSDHVTKLPFTVQQRMVSRHDILLAMVPLIENPPWVRKVRAAGGSGPTKWYKYVARAWREVPPADLLKLTPTEGQPWLCVYNLLQEPEVRKQYALNSHRKAVLSRLRKYVNDVLVDQLPMLAEVQRTLDEMSIMAVPEASADAAARSALLLETLPVIQEGLVRDALRDARLAPYATPAAAAALPPTAVVPAAVPAAPPAATPATAPAAARHGGFLDVAADGEPGAAAAVTALLSIVPAAPGAAAAGSGAPATAAAGGSGGDTHSWKEAAAWVLAHVFVTAAAPSAEASVADLRAAAAAYTDDAWMDLALGDPKCNRCGAVAAKRCSRCKNVWYCGRECQVADWTAHKAMCDVVATAPPPAAKRV